MSWYYAKEGRQVGPVGEADFEGLVRGGVVGSDTLVWREGMPAWQPYAVVAGGAAGPASAPAACSQCGRTFPADDMIRYGDRWVCATCKPVFVQGLKEGVVTTSQLNYAGFWIRFGARFLDGVIMWVVG